MSTCDDSSEEETRKEEPVAAKNKEFAVQASNNQEEKTLDKRLIAVALLTLQSSNKLLLNFERGDQLIIEDDSDPDWYLARHAYEGQRGFVLKSHLSLDEFGGEESWYFGDINRETAERLLLHPDNENRAFLVRSSKPEGTFALSLKEFNHKTNKKWIPHFKIRTLEEGGVFMTEKEPFDTLKDLVAYFSKDTYGVILKLKQPCLRPRVPDPLPHSRDELEVPFDSLHFVRDLEGDFGRVSLGLWNYTVKVAIKRFESEGALRREAAILKALSHRKIVMLYAICTEKAPFFSVMEYMFNGNLLQYLKTDEGKRLKLPALVDISAQIAEGMAYLEANSVIHRDLAARNILVGGDCIVKLAGFGRARIVDKVASLEDGETVPVKWTAPEVYTEGEFTIKSDVWSFGIVLYEIFTHGGMPYSGMKNVQVVHSITKLGHRLLQPSDPECNDAVYEMMTMCWKMEPEDRPTFEFLHHFFADFSVASEAPKREAQEVITSDWS